MKLHYDPETDSPYIELANRPGADAFEIADGVVVDLDGYGSVIGLDIEHASKKVDLTSIETNSLPLLATKSA